MDAGIDIKIDLILSKIFIEENEKEFGCRNYWRKMQHGVGSTQKLEENVWKNDLDYVAVIALIQKGIRSLHE